MWRGFFRCNGPGVGFTKSIITFTFPLFPFFSESSKYSLPLEYHIDIWQCWHHAPPPPPPPPPPVSNLVLAVGCTNFCFGLEIILQDMIRRHGSYRTSTSPRDVCLSLCILECNALVEAHKCFLYYNFRISPNSMLVGNKLILEKQLRRYNLI